MENESAIADRTTLRDWGNGFIILGCILLAVYSALALLSSFMYADGEWKVWTYPYISWLSMIAILSLFLAGTVLRFVQSSRS